MKMTREDYNSIVEAFEFNSHNVIAHYEQIKKSGKYNVLEVRVAFDCVRAFLGTSFITGQYDKGLNDNHVRTACVKALKHVLNNEGVTI